MCWNLRAGRGGKEIDRQTEGEQEWRRENHVVGGGERRKGNEIKTADIASNPI